MVVGRSESEEKGDGSPVLTSENGAGGGKRGFPKQNENMTFPMEKVLCRNRKKQQKKEKRLDSYGD